VLAFSRTWVQLYHAKHGGDKELTLKFAQKVTAGFVGCTDFPYICITSELLELYPEAKVVLITRDPKECWGSFSMILNYSDAWFVPYLSIIAPSLRWWPALVSAWKKETDILLSETGAVAGQYGPGKLDPTMYYTSLGPYLTMPQVSSRPIIGESWNWFRRRDC
jgi:hypothetical protein